MKLHFTTFIGYLPPAVPLERDRWNSWRHDLAALVPALPRIQAMCCASQSQKKEKGPSDARQAILIYGHLIAYYIYILSLSHGYHCNSTIYIYIENTCMYVWMYVCMHAHLCEGFVVDRGCGYWPNSYWFDQHPSAYWERRPFFMAALSLLW